MEFNNRKQRSEQRVGRIRIKGVWKKVRLPMWKNQAYTCGKHTNFKIQFSTCKK